MSERFRVNKSTVTVPVYDFLHGDDVHLGEREYGIGPNIIGHLFPDEVFMHCGFPGTGWAWVDGGEIVAFKKASGGLTHGIIRDKDFEALAPLDKERLYTSILALAQDTVVLDDKTYAVFTCRRELIVRTHGNRRWGTLAPGTQIATNTTYVGATKNGILFHHYKKGGDTDWTPCSGDGENYLFIDTHIGDNSMLDTFDMITLGADPTLVYPTVDEDIDPPRVWENGAVYNKDTNIIHVNFGFDDDRIMSSPAEAELSLTVLDSSPGGFTFYKHYMPIDEASHLSYVQFDIDLPANAIDGTHGGGVRVKDASGNWSGIRGFNFTVDRSVPVPPEPPKGPQGWFSEDDGQVFTDKMITVTYLCRNFDEAFPSGSTVTFYKYQGPVAEDESNLELVEQISIEGGTYNSDVDCYDLTTVDKVFDATAWVNGQYNLCMKVNNGTMVSALDVLRVNIGDTTNPLISWLTPVKETYQSPIDIKINVWDNKSVDGYQAVLHWDAIPIATATVEAPDAENHNDGQAIFEITEDLIQTYSGEGWSWFWVTVTDEAGNVGNLSSDGMVKFFYWEDEPPTLMWSPKVPNPLPITGTFEFEVSVKDDAPVDKATARILFKDGKRILEQISVGIDTSSPTATRGRVRGKFDMDHLRTYQGKIDWIEVEVTDIAGHTESIAANVEFPDISDSFDNPETLTLPFKLEAWVDKDNDEDWYTFTPTVSGTYLFAVSVAEPCTDVSNTGIFLYDMDEWPMYMSNIETSSINNQRFYKVDLVAGKTYKMEVNGGFNYSSGAVYKATIIAEIEPVDTYTDPNITQIHCPGTHPVRLEGDINDPVDYDWFKVVAEQTTNYKFYTNTTGSQTYQNPVKLVLKVLDDSGNAVAAGMYNHADGMNAVLYATLEKDKIYYVRISRSTTTGTINPDDFFDLIMEEAEYETGNSFINAKPAIIPGTVTTYSDVSGDADMTRFIVPYNGELVISGSKYTAVRIYDELHNQVFEANMDISWEDVLDDEAPWSCTLVAPKDSSYYVKSYARDRGIYTYDVTLTNRIPIAAIGMSPTAATMPEGILYSDTVITFTNDSTDADNDTFTNVEWELDSQVGANPSGTFAEGSHTVRLRVQDEFGNWSDWVSVTFDIEAPNTKPVAVITMTPDQNITTDTIITWSASASYDPDGSIAVEEWENNSSQYVGEGEQTVRLRVQDNRGMWSDWTSVTFMVTKPAKPIQVCAGSRHYGVVYDNGTVRMHGPNQYAQLGTGDTDTPAAPVEISLSNVKSMTMGDNHTIFVLNDGTMKSCGQNNVGQTGQGYSSTFAYPNDVVGITNAEEAEACYNCSFVTLTDNNVWSWGEDGSYQLGDANSVDKKSPVLADELPANSTKQVGAGWNHTLFLQNDNTVLAVGDNYDGQIGDGTSTDRPWPVAVRNIANVKQVAAGWHISAAVLNDGTVWTWGVNDIGQLGLGYTSTLDTRSPVQVPGITNAVQVAVGLNFMMVLLADGTVKSWGENNYGQLGIGSSTDKYSPVDVLKYEGGYSPLTGITQIHASNRLGIALKDDGTVYTWGMGLTKYAKPIVGF